MPRIPRPAALTTAILLALPGLVLADNRGDAHDHDTARTLDAVEVTASPLRNAIDDLARPVEVLAGEELDARKAGTLGETLERQTGVQSSYFGAGVGRPIIRGQDGARVQVLTGGTGAADVSTISADHAVTIEPFLADQIEVLKGPATLLYGSGAIGGAVNVVDGRVPTQRAGRDLTGRAEIRHGSVSDENTGMGRIDADAGPLTFHADLFRRDSGDYRIPGYAFSPELIAEELAEGEELEHFARGRLPNSALTTEGGAVGASWFGERAWFGASANTYRSNYGIPPGAHAHEGGEEEDEEHGEEVVRLDLRQDRLDLRGGFRGLGPLQELNWRATRSQYEHTEFEGDAVGTVFENEGTEVRLEAVQNEIAGWRGAFGLQYGRRDFAAIGDEAFVPPSVTRDAGLFLVQERDFGDFKLELGARHDRVRIDPEGALADVERNATSLAVGGLWRFSELMHLSINLDRAERAPTAEELFSDGPHIATQSYEIGDAALDKESATSAELGLHLHQGRFEGKLSVYRTAFDDFIYLSDTGAELDGLPVRAWIQGDATFTGWEAEGSAELFENASGLWTLRVFADGVDAKLDDGGRLPRIAPGRVGADLNWSLAGWRARIGAVRVAEQDEVAAGESATDGYTLVDAGLAYHWDVGATGWEAFLEGRNLTNQEARAHTSFLKDFASLPGRNVAVGLRVSF
ncbi:TonB-dependent receptor [Arenimonas terrae]|uniref:TonB-dependent receptor n=1 Tax=Arenimonas terrae TaxID=2546226 RepID=A0A5C4RWG5_9GAMM|nr:TonB-dependent receptor [Arenimonas terrae]TNJ35262.1 TonB-dependent receptor [Arenimonas terrae]